MFHLLLLFSCLVAFPHSGSMVQGSMPMLPQLMHLMKEAEKAYANATAMPCSDKTTKDCCPMCDYCDKCDYCEVCETMWIDICKYCPQCAEDCVQSGYCGTECNVTDLPETRPCYPKTDCPDSAEEA